MTSTQPQPTAAAQPDQEFLHSRARAVVGRFCARHFKRRTKLNIAAGDQGVWDALHNGIYVALATANKLPDYSTELLTGSTLSRPGISATAVLASLYSVVSSQLETAKKYYGHPDNIAEHEKLLAILAPIVAGLKPRSEGVAYTAAQTVKYNEQRAGQTE